MTEEAQYESSYICTVTEKELLQHLHSNPFLLAPMAGITGSAFRQAMRERGTGIVISELVSANGLKYASEKTKALMAFEDCERPVGLQIFGEDGENMALAARYVEDLGADFVDINLGCPVRKVVSKGGGSALLRDPIHLGKLLTQVKNAIGIPLTIKIRTGWDHPTKNAPEIVQVAADAGVTWVAIHGRTRSQAYNGEADWDYIAEVRVQSSLPIIGNGDITSPQLAVQRLQESGCDGVMIGRGCLKNPWIFQEALDLWKEGSVVERPRDYLEYFDFLEKEFSRLQSDKFVAIQMRKLSAWCSAGYPGSAQFRKDIFSLREKEETMELISSFFSRIGRHRPSDTSHERFLQGGHG